MSAAAALFAHHLRRLLRPGRLLGLSALAAVPGLAAWLAAAGTHPEEATRTYQLVTVSVPAATFSIAALALGAAVMRDEREGGTLPYLLLKPVNRWVFSGMAWLAAAVAALLVGAVGWAVGWAAVGVQGDAWEAGLPAASLFAGAAVGYTALFVPLGYLVPRAFLVGLGYVFVWEGIVAALVPGLAQTSVWRIALSIYADLERLPTEAGDVLGAVAPGAGGGAAKLAGLTLVGVAALTWSVRHRDAV